jgi:cytochrome b6-f complex iron-sulfur subunit
MPGRGGAGYSRRWLLQAAVAGCGALIAAACSRGHSKSNKGPPSSSSATTAGFPLGPTIDVGTVTGIRASLTSTRAPRYVPQARAYVSVFPPELADDAQGVYPAEVLPLLDAGLVVLHQRCPHLGCRVPFCESSQWFECPCHAARFDRSGEYRAGPSPRGMTLMSASIDKGRLILRPGTTYPGLPIGTDTTRQKPAGPFCVGG